MGQACRRKAFLPVRCALVALIHTQLLLLFPVCLHPYSGTFAFPCMPRQEPHELLAFFSKIAASLHVIGHAMMPV